jgi:hypothetical protein
MGRVMPRDFVKAVSEYLDQAAPARKKEMIDAIKARAEELVDADEDLALDAAGTGAMRSARWYSPRSRRSCPCSTGRAPHDPPAPARHGPDPAAPVRADV